MHKLKFLSILIILVLSLALAGNVYARPLAATSPNLGAADSFAILAGTPNITNVPTSQITGDVGLSPAAGAGIGLTAAQVTGTIYTVDATGPAGSVKNPAYLTNAKKALVTAYNRLSSTDNVPCTTTYTGVKDLVGLTLVPGVYCAGSSFALSGTLILDDTDNAGGVWIFRSPSTSIADGTAKVQFLNGTGSSCNVWWKVTSSATLGTGTVFIGNIIALTSITLKSGATLDGRALARNGAVTLANNTITRPVCSAAALALTTTASGPVTVGANITDTAHLTGGTGLVGGTITFDVFAPGDTTCNAPIAVAGGPVNGSGSYTSASYPTTLVGNYRWIAHYNSGGEVPTILNTACNDSGETSLVTAVGVPTATAVIPGLPETGGGAPIRSEASPWSLIIVGGIGMLALVSGVWAFRRSHLPKQ